MSTSFNPGARFRRMNQISRVAASIGSGPSAVSRSSTRSRSASATANARAVAARSASRARSPIRSARSAAVRRWSFRSSRSMRRCSSAVLSLVSMGVSSWWGRPRVGPAVVVRMGVRFRPGGGRRAVASVRGRRPGARSRPSRRATGALPTGRDPARPGRRRPANRWRRGGRRRTASEQCLESHRGDRAPRAGERRAARARPPRRAASERVMVITGPSSGGAGVGAG